MQRVPACAATLALALLTTACAEFESGSSSPLGPSSVAAVAAGGGTVDAQSLLGTWNAVTGQSVSGSSCTNLQWQITNQNANAIDGTFSFDCVGNIHASGTASGQINGNDVPYQVVGTGTIPGLASCPFSLSGTARIEGDALRIPYSGTTCLGPIRGEETLRRPAQAAPPSPPDPVPAPPPAPAPPPPPPSDVHVGPGPTSAARAELVVNATAAEYAHLTAPRPSDSEALAASHELLLRMIWHLQLAGFQAGRQKNPSGAISGDKLAVFADGGWHAYDVFYDVGVAHVTTKVIFFEVFPPSPLADGGIPD